MSHYTFETSAFGLSDEGLHLLRSGYNYKTIAYHDIRKVTLKRAAAIKNVLLVLLLGVALLVFAIYQAIRVYESFSSPDVHTIAIESILLPVLPLFLGNYCMYVALKRTSILLVRYKGGRKKLPLKAIVNTDHGPQLVTYLQEKLGARFFVEGHDALLPESEGVLEEYFG